MSSFECGHFNEFACWSALHIIYLIVASVLLLLLVYTTFICSFSVQNFSMTSKSIFSCAPSAYHTTFWLIKLCLCLLKSLANQERAYTDVPDLFKFVLLLCVSVWLKRATDGQYRNYSPAGRRAVLSLSLIALLAAAVSVVVFGFHSVYPVNGSIIWMAVVVLGGLQQLHEKYGAGNSYIASKSFWKRISGIFHIILLKEYSRKNIISLRGFLMDYIKNSDDIKLARAVSTQLNTSSESSTNVSQQKEILHKIVETEFKRETHKAQAAATGSELLCTSLSLVHAQYLVEVCKKGRSALVILKKIRPQQLWAEFYRYRLVRIIEDLEYQSDKSGQERNLLKLMKEEAVILKLLESEGESYVRLWNYVGTEMPEVSRVEELVVKIIEMEEKVKASWARIESFGILKPSLYKSYINYLENVHGDYVASNRLRIIQQELHRNSNKDSNFAGLDLNTFHEMKTPMFFASAELKDMGVIQRGNAAFSQLFGYLPSEVAGLPMERMLSNVYKPYNKPLMMNLVDSHLLHQYKNKFVFGKRKGGHVFPAKMKVRKIISLSDDAQLVVSLEQLKASALYLVTNLCFQVVDIGEDVNSSLGLSRKVVKDRAVYVSKMCPDLFEGHKLKQLASYKGVRFYLPSYTPEELDYYKIIAPHYSHLRDQKKPTDLKALVNLNSFLAISSDKYIECRVDIEALKYDHHIGYSFAFTLPDALEETKEVEEFSPVPKSRFMFVYDGRYGGFYRDYREKAGGSLADEEMAHADGSSNLMLPNAQQASNCNKCFVEIVKQRIAAVKSSLPSKQSKQFSAYVNTYFHPTDYGANIATYNISDMGRPVVSVPYLLVGEKGSEVADEAEISASNMMLKKQDEELRLRELMLTRADTVNYVRDQFQLPAVLKQFFVLITLLNIGFMMIGIIENVHVYRTKKRVKISLNYTIESFYRVSIVVQLNQLLGCTVLYNE